MALIAGFDLNLTMKQGVTITANELVSWVDTVASRDLTPPVAFTGPSTNIVSLDGVPVASFNGTDEALQLIDATYTNVVADFGEPVIQHYMIRFNSDAGNWNYVRDTGGDSNKNAVIYFDTGNLTIRHGLESYEYLSLPLDQWLCLTVKSIGFDNAGVDETHVSIWIDDTKVVTDAVIPIKIQGGEGITLGARGDLGFGEAKFDLAQVVDYNNVALTDQQIQDNIQFLRGDWGLIAGDNTAPTPGGNMQSENVLSDSFDITFDKATDDTSAQSNLRYYLHTSETNNLTTDAATVEANGTLQNAGGTLDVASLSATGLTPGTQYYANVVVEDGAGNKSIYTQLAVTSASRVSGKVTKDGLAQASTEVAILSMNDVDFTGIAYVETVTTDADGIYDMTAVYNGAKHYLAVPLYLTVLESGTADSATATTLTDAALAMTIDEYNDSKSILRITGGTGAGQERVVTSNTATEFTVRDSWTVTPDGTSTYELVDILSGRPGLIPSTE